MAPRQTKQRQEQTLRELEDLARRVGLRVSFGDLKFAGLRLKSGRCLFRGEHWLVVDRQDPFEDKVDLFLEAFEDFDLSQEQVSPEMARLLAAGRFSGKNQALK